MARWDLVGPLAIVLFGALFACKNKGNPAVVKGSCDMRGGSGAGSAICIDFHVEPNAKVQAICSPSAGYNLSTGACDRTGALGGCQKGNLTNWYYPSSVHTSASQVQSECTDTFVSP